MIKLELMQENAVVVAHHFNPSIITQHWLIKNGILAEDEFKPGGLFSDMAVHSPTKNFILLVVPDQLQLLPTAGKQNGTLIQDKLGKILELLPHTPYHAVGLNFAWLASSKVEGMESFSRKFFFKSHNPLYDAFATKDARFGGYFSRNILGCRLKLDIKPVTINIKDKLVLEKLQFAFNYHLELNTDNKVDAIKKHLQCWDEASRFAQELVETTLKMVEK